MKNSVLYLIISVIILISVIGFLVYHNNNSRSNDYPETQKLSIEFPEKNEESNAENPDNYSEIEISSYFTEILDKSEGRLNNIKITCETLNEHVVHVGEVFSFEDLVTPVTSEKGYQKAKIIENGETAYALGGR